MKFKELIKRFKFQRKKRVRTSCNVYLDMTFLTHMEYFDIIKSEIQGIHLYVHYYVTR